MCIYVMSQDISVSIKTEVQTRQLGSDWLWVLPSWYQGLFLQG